MIICNVEAYVVSHVYHYEMRRVKKCGMVLPCFCFEHS